MMTLISLGITAAFGTSLAATFGFLNIDVWWELTSLITIMLLGHWLEMRAVSQARGALNALAALLNGYSQSAKCPPVSKPRQCKPGLNFWRFLLPSTLLGANMA
jgi:hypothetical protein